MKIEVNNNTVIFNHNKRKIEIHPIWLRERVNGEVHLDQNTNQRLFDPSLLDNISINKISINKKILELTFSDGITSTFDIKKLTAELLENESTLNIMRMEAG